MFAHKMNLFVSSILSAPAIASLSFSSRSQICFRKRPTSTKDAISGSISAMAKKPDLDEPTRQIAERLLSMPPKPHKERKIGKRKAKTIARMAKDRVAAPFLDALEELALLLR